MQLALINLTHATRDEQRESHDPAALLGHDKKLLLNIVSCPTVPPYAPAYFWDCLRTLVIYARIWHKWGR
jgi:hypothetical protein